MQDPVCQIKKADYYDCSKNQGGIQATFVININAKTGLPFGNPVLILPNAFLVNSGNTILRTRSHR